MTMGADEGVPVDPRTEELMLLNEAAMTLATGASVLAEIGIVLQGAGMERTAQICARVALHQVSLTERVMDTVKRVEDPGYDREDFQVRIGRELDQVVQG